jgi:hypothetical protein
LKGNSGAVKKTSLVLPLVLVSLFLAGCATSNLGTEPIAVQAQPDTFFFKMYARASGHRTIFDIFGPSHREADVIVKIDIEKFQENSGYLSHKILGRRFNSIPSYFEYTVKFSR